MGKSIKLSSSWLIEMDMRWVAWHDSHMGWPAVDTSSCRLPWEGRQLYTGMVLPVQEGWKLICKEKQEGLKQGSGMIMPGL